ncbi:hypothetical protein ACFSQ7_37100 [Paenibacillus rhizoplanae]
MPAMFYLSPLQTRKKPELKAKEASVHAIFAISSGFACITSYTLPDENMKL